MEMHSVTAMMLFSRVSANEVCDSSDLPLLQSITLIDGALACDAREGWWAGEPFCPQNTLTMKGAYEVNE